MKSSLLIIKLKKEKGNDAKTTKIMSFLQKNYLIWFDVTR